MTENPPTESAPLNPPSSRPSKYFHWNLSSIADGRDNAHAIAYVFDRTKEALWLGANGARLHYKQMGLPRLVSTVTLPGSNGQTSFSFPQEPGFVQPISPAFPDTILRVEGPERVTANHAVQVKDAAGNKRWYVFSGIDVLDVDEVVGNRRPDDPSGDQLVAYYTHMKIMTQHDPLNAQNHFSEEYSFEPTAGLALASAKDASGNVTSYEYNTTCTAFPDYFGLGVIRCPRPRKLEGGAPLARERQVEPQDSPHLKVRHPESPGEPRAGEGIELLLHREPEGRRDAAIGNGGAEHRLTQHMGRRRAGGGRGRVVEAQDTGVACVRYPQVAPMVEPSKPGFAGWMALDLVGRLGFMAHGDRSVRQLQRHHPSCHHEFPS